MWRCLRNSLPLLLAAAPLPAQRAAAEVAYVELSAPRNEVLSARQLALRARGYSAAGASIAGFAQAWGSSRPEVAAVDSRGVVTGRRPGVAVIEVRTAAGASDSITIQVNPARVEVQPSPLTIAIGERKQVTATAYDADNQPIPQTAFRWTTGLAGIARAEAGGFVTGVAEGATSLVAMVDTGAAAAGFATSVSIEVRPRDDFRLKRIAFSDDESTAAHVVSHANAVTSGDNAVAATLQLSNGGQVIALWRNNQWRTLAEVGKRLPEPGVAVSSVQTLSVNDNGDVAAAVTIPAEWCWHAILLFRASRNWAPELATEHGACGINLSPRALGANGELAYLWSGRVIYRTPDGRQSTLLSNSDTVAGVGPALGIGNPFVGASGALAVLVTSQTTSAMLVRPAAGGALTPILKYGDQIESFTARTFDNNFVEAAPGEWVTRVHWPNGTALARYAGGRWSLPVRSGVNDVNWIHNQYDVRGSSILLIGGYAPEGGNDRLIRILNGKADSLGPASWSDSRSISIAGAGGALLALMPSSAKATLFRYPASEKTGVRLLELKAPYAGPAAAGFSHLGIIRGAVSGGGILRMGNTLPYAVTAAGLSPLLPAAAADRRLNLIHGSSASGSGDVVLVGSDAGLQGLYSLKGGTLRTYAEQRSTQYLGPNNRTINGFWWGDNTVAVNSQGRLAAVAGLDTGAQLAYWSAAGATPSTILVFNGTLVGGTAVRWLNSLAIDENGRVMFIANRTDGLNGLYLWENGALSSLLTVNSNGPDGRRVNGLISLLAAGTKFYVRLDAGTATSNHAEVREYDNGRWRTVLTNAESLAGVNVNWFYGAEFAANARGETALNVNTPNGALLAVRRAGQPDRAVASAARRGPEGEWFLSIHSVAIADGGEVVFTAFVWLNGRERLALYHATPQ
jgi:hypothetical protein